MQRPTGAHDRPAADVLKKFRASLHDLHVEAHVVKNEAETEKVLQGILSGAGCKSVVVAGVPMRYSGAVKAALTGLKTDVVEELSGRPQEDVIGILAGADAGVTWMDNGVALEGAMLEVVYDDSAKLASSLPMLHVALLESSSIVHDLAEALPIVGEIVRSSPPEKKPIISFISGPSKTGDIEMRLLYGVHGPHTVHAVILDWH
jgi:L-lactate dehydrogenase complex protein LldG